MPHYQDYDCNDATIPVDVGCCLGLVNRLLPIGWSCSCDGHLFLIFSDQISRSEINS